MISYLGVIRTVMIADTGQFNRSMMGAAATTRNAARQMRMSAQSLVGIGAALNVAVTMPVIMATRAIVKFGAAYDTQMMKIRHVTGLTTKDMLALDRAQVEISRSTGMRISELQQIGYLAAQAQIMTVKGVAAIQRSVAKAQAVLKGDAPSDKVAEGFLSILKSFNVEEKDFELVMAQMVKTIDLGRMTWEQYAGSIQQVAAIAASMKGAPLQNLQNLNIALALASQGGVAGGSVATAIRNIYTRVYKQGTKKDASFMDLMAQQVGAAGAIDLFEKGSQGDITKFIKNITQDGKFATPEAATLMGVMQREITAFLRIGKTDPAEIDRFVQEYGKAWENFQTRFKDAGKETTMSMARVAAEFEIVKMKFWKAMGGWPTKFLNGVADFLKKISDMPDSSKRLFMLIAGLAALGSVLLLVVGLINSAVLTLRLNALLSRGVGAAKGAGVVASGVGIAGASNIKLPKLGSGEKLFTPKGSSVPTQIRNAKGQIVKNLWAGTAAGGAAGSALSKGPSAISNALAAISKSLAPLLASLKVAALGIAKVVGVIYLVRTVFLVLKDALAVTLLPALREAHISFSGLGEVLAALGKVLSTLDLYIVRGLTVAFVTLLGVLQNIFGVLIGVGATLVQSFDYVFTMIRRGIEGLIDSVRNSWIGRRMGWELSSQETKARQTDRTEARGKEFRDIGEWQKYTQDQLKGIFGAGASSAAVGNINRLAEKWWGGDEYTPPDGKMSESEQADYLSKLRAQHAEYLKVISGFGVNKQVATAASNAAIPQIERQPESSAFLQYGSAASYEAVSSSRNSVISILNQLREDALNANKDQKRRDEAMMRIMGENAAYDARMAEATETIAELAGK